MADIAERARNKPSLKNVVLCAKRWLRECLADHKHCKGVPASSDYPRRLIKIDKRKENEWDLQLVPTNGKTVEYCALSYCWGLETDNFASTTDRNVESRYQGFPAEDLPQTLQDAIIVCRLLEILYLWIDAICIVQGDLQDWTIESSRMDQIYSGAAMTLIATASLHANDGLLVPRWQSNGASWSRRPKSRSCASSKPGKSSQSPSSALVPPIASAARRSDSREGARSIRRYMIASLLSRLRDLC